MKIAKTKVCVAAAVSGLLAGASVKSASAALLTETVSLPGFVVFNSTENFTVPLFDPSLGTLTGVSVGGDLNMNGMVQSSVTWFPLPGQQNGTAGANFSLMDSGSITTSAGGLSDAFSLQTPSVYGSTSGSSITVFISSDVQLATANVSSSALSNYELSGSASTMELSFDPGPITATYSPIPSMAMILPPSLQVSQLASGNLTVSYTYTPAASVPEPTGLGLVSIAAAGLLRRRRV